MNEAKQKALAYEIASKLDDLKALGLHEIFVSRYSEEFLREILDLVLSITQKDIRTTRARYYTHLVKTRGASKWYGARN